MIGEARDLYQAMILDHGKRPRNFRRIEGTSTSAEGFNPLCGDHVTVFALVEAGVLRDVSFVGDGCAICKASASMMTERLKGRSLAEARNVFGRFHELVVDGIGTSDDAVLGKLKVFEGVRAFPVRIKCATLGWHALRRALEPLSDAEWKGAEHE